MYTVEGSVHVCVCGAGGRGYYTCPQDGLAHFWTKSHNYYDKYDLDLCGY